MELTLYGASGFIGTKYVETFSNRDSIWLTPRSSRCPDPNKITDMLYLISTTHNYNVFTDPTLDVRTNLVVLTETLAAWKQLNPTGTFNFISSWFVYGDTGLNHVDEHAPCNPKGFYSITKYAAEQLVQSFAETFGLKYRILRLCNIIGPGDRGASKQKNALQYLINEMKAGRDIDLYDNGDFQRTYMDVDDCVRALRLVMLDGVKNTIYNIGTHPSHKFGDLITYAHGKLKSTSVINNIEPKDFHKQVQVKSFTMDCSALYDLGFNQKYDIRHSLDRMIE
jgi:nucleoside-diphosphate-sugar epimerase